MTWRRGERWSPVTRVVVFIVWRSFNKIPGVRDAIEMEFQGLRRELGVNLGEMRVGFR